VSAEPAQPQAEAGFSPKVVLALLAVGVFATAAYLLLTAYAPEMRANRGGGAHAESKSAIGYAGAVRLLQLMHEPVFVSQSSEARNSFPGLMVLTPPPFSRLGKVETEHPRLIVLPKWTAEPDPAHPGWQVNAAALPEAFAAAALPETKGVTVERRKPGENGPARLTGDATIWPEDGLPVGPVQQLQTLSSNVLTPLVQDEQGRILLGAVPGGHLYILSDPDLLNTQGLRDPRTARVAAAILLALKTDNEPIAFDVSVTEAGGQKSLLRAAIEPPFLASTLCLVAVAGLLGLQAWFRFGAPRRAPRAVALGKTALVETGAGMVRLARREPQMARRYVQLCRQRAAGALGAAHLEGEALDAFLDRWAERVGAEGRISALAAEARAVTNIMELTALAQRARRWRVEVTRGPE